MFPSTGVPSNPITLPVRISPTQPHYAIPITGPSHDVQGFEMTATMPPTQAQADGLATKLQGFYDALPPEERLIMAALLDQAAAYCE